MNNLRLRSNFSQANAWSEHIKKLRQAGKIPAPAAWMEAAGRDSRARRKPDSPCSGDS